jgi:HTH-type transcriptional regulator/antitoxin HipB
MSDDEYPLQAPERIAEALRARRKQLKLTQAEIAGLAGLLPKTVSALENSPERCGVESLLKLSSFLGLELVLAPRSLSVVPSFRTLNGYDGESS